MRIALLSHFYPPTHTAGIEQYTHSLARGLIGAGHQVHVLCCGTWDAGDDYYQGFTDEEWQGVPVRRLHVNWTKAPRPHEYLSDSPVLGRYTRKFLTEFGSELVHLTSMYALSTSAIDAAKSLALPVVCTLCDFWTICPRHTLMKYGGVVCDGRVTVETCQDCLMSESKVYRAFKHVVPRTLLNMAVSSTVSRPELARRLPAFRGWGFDVTKRRAKISQALAKVDCLLTPSAYVSDVVTGTGIVRSLEVLNHGHDLDWLERYTRRTPDGTVRFGYIGQVVPIKGVLVLLEAFLAAGFGERATLSIHGGTREGTTAYERELREKAKGAANVSFMGPYGRPDLPNVLGALDAIVVPSIWPDVAPLVVQEAFAAGLPVIASRIGGLPEFVQAGMTVAPGNAVALRRVLEDLVAGGEPYLSTLRAAIPPIRSRHDDVDFLVRTYTRLRSVQTAAAR